MNRAGSRIAAGLVAAALLPVLAGCTPGVATWAYLHDDGSVSFGLCQAPGRVDSVRFSYLVDEGTSWSEKSALALSGPRVDFGESRVIDRDSFPSSWISAGSPQAPGAWDRAEVEVFIGDTSHELEYADRDELKESTWVLLNAGIGAISCDAPVDAPFVAEPGGEPAVDSSTTLDAAEAQAMSPDEFWATIGSPSADGTGAQLDEIAMRLRALTDDEAVAFDTRLRLELLKLDSLETWNTALHLGSTSMPTSVSESEFLRFRCALVLAGEASAVPDGEDEAWTTLDDARVLSLALESHPAIAVPAHGIDLAFRANTAGWQRTP